MKTEIKRHWKRSKMAASAEIDEKIIFVDVDKEDSNSNSNSRDSSTNFNGNKPNFDQSTAIFGTSTNFSTNINNNSTNFDQNSKQQQQQQQQNSTPNEKQASNEKSTSNFGQNLSGGPKKSYLDMAKHRQFCKNLKVLNESVLNWIDKHLKSNPYLDLTPVFNDYLTHYKNLEQKFNVAGGNRDTTTESASKKRPHETESDKEDSQKPIFNNSASSNEKKSAPKVTFGFVGTKNSDVSDDSRSSSSNLATFAPVFGTKNSAAPSTVTTSSKFSFGFGASQSSSKEKESRDENGTGTKSRDVKGTEVRGENGKESRDEKQRSDSPPKPFKKFCFFTSSKNENESQNEKSQNDSTTNGGNQPKQNLFAFLPNKNQAASSENKEDGTGNGNEDGEYEPPKPESVQIEEKDAFYSIRCKLFYKSEEKFVEKGIGTLHLKKLDGGKTQLLIRNDTALGSILLNICLSESMPCTRTGKNNVSIVCVPNPPLQPNSVVLKEGTNEGVDTAEPTLMLIRVKTGQDADELHAKISAAKSAA